MKMRLKIATVIVAALFQTTLKAQTMNTKDNEVQSIFPKGEKGSAKTFTGNAYNYPLVDNDSMYTTVVGNVYFEPGARSNWHSHPSGTNSYHHRRCRLSPNKRKSGANHPQRRCG